MRLKQGCKGMWIVPAVLIADRITKVAAQMILQTPPEISYAPMVKLVPGILNARYAQNTGIAFSMFSGRGLMLVLFTLVLIAALAAWLIAKPDEPKLFRAGLWLIVGGGLGNLYDRIVYGYVIDFLELAFVRFAIFNIADVCICAGAGLAMLALIMDEMRAKKKKPEGE